MPLVSGSLCQKSELIVCSRINCLLRKDHHMCGEIVTSEIHPPSHHHNHHQTQLTATMSLQIKSLYRRLLRELPIPGTTTATAAVPKNSKPSHLSHSTPIKHRLRHSLQNSSAASEKESIHHHLQVTEQFVQYLKAQRTYATLVERYNPGMNMDDGERVRLSARRIGMNLPVEFETEVGKK